MIVLIAFCVCPCVTHVYHQLNYICVAQEQTQRADNTYVQTQGQKSWWYSCVSLLQKRPMMIHMFKSWWYACVSSALFAKETYDNTYFYCVLMFMSGGTWKCSLCYTCASSAPLQKRPMITHMFIVCSCLCLMIHMCRHQARTMIHMYHHVYIW